MPPASLFSLFCRRGEGGSDSNWHPSIPLPPPPSLLHTLLLLVHLPPPSSILPTSPHSSITLNPPSPRPSPGWLLILLVQTDWKLSTLVNQSQSLIPESSLPSTTLISADNASTPTCQSNVSLLLSDMVQGA